MTVVFNGYTVQDLLDLNEKLRRHESFLEWCLKKAKENGRTYIVVRDEILKRFPELRDKGVNSG